MIIDPVCFARQLLEVDPHPGQKLWLRNSNGPENALVTGNRWGKSFVSAIKILHRAIFRIRPLEFDRQGRYRAVTAAITQNQANLVFGRVVQLLRQSAIAAPMMAELKWSPYPLLTLGNGATIEARSTQNRGEYLLGNDYDYFIFDEVAFETHPEYVVEEVILMRLADREGMLDLVSTPNGKNWFYRRFLEIASGQRKGFVLSGDSRDNPHVSAEFLKSRIEYFTDSRRKQNIMGQFVDTGGEILKGEYVDRALSHSDTTTDDKSISYISGWDLARKRTATVGVTVAVGKSGVRVVKLERFRRFDWMVVLDRIKRRQLEYPGRLVVDATGLGDVICEQLAEFNPTSVIFTPSSKAELLTNVELFHARDEIGYDRWELPDGAGKTWSFEDELRQATWDDNNECDSLMALSLALWPLRKRDLPPMPPRVGMI